MYISFVLGQVIKDSGGKDVGKLLDLIASPSAHLPVISAAVVKSGNQTKNIAWSSIAYDKNTERFSLSTTSDQAKLYKTTDDDLFLATNLMDKQIVDVHDYRVVRVNDVRVEPSGRKMYLVGVDTGARGLLRRIGLMQVADKLTKFVARIKILPNAKIDSNIIAWADVETFERGINRIKLKVSAERLSALHPSDIAKIIDELDPEQRADIIETLDIETAAEVLTEAHPDVQASIVENLEDELAADILEEMEPDEAADILGDVSEDKRDDILEEMNPEDAEDVKELLAYNDNTAGGLMTTEYISISKELTAQQTIEKLRELASDAEMVYYIFVVDSSDRLVGVISLKDLIIAQPNDLVEDFMVSKIIYVYLDAEIDEIAQKLNDYNLLALPVVDEENYMQGIITVDDVLEELIPEDAKERMPRIWR